MLDGSGPQREPPTPAGGTRPSRRCRRARVETSAERPVRWTRGYATTLIDIAATEVDVTVKDVAGVGYRSGKSKRSVRHRA
jgi:hypothetical protein